MCYERWLRRRDEAEESRSVWEDFERTRPLAGQEPEDAPPEPIEAEKETTLSER
jgi:hypothetical protein